jgi:hypothetical protein
MRPDVLAVYFFLVTLNVILLNVLAPGKSIYIDIESKQDSMESTASADFGATTFSTTTLSRMTLSNMGLFTPLSINDIQHIGTIH